MNPTMIPPDLRPGYAQIQAASRLAPDAEAWDPFVRDVLGMPLSMLRGVQYAVNTKAWRLAWAGEEICGELDYTARFKRRP